LRGLGVPVPYVSIVNAKETKQIQEATGTEPKLLTYDELAGRIGCTVRHLQMQVQRRRIPAIKCGRLVRFNWSAVLRALEQQ
jgi:excisionase family DNA binding protein